MVANDILPWALQGVDLGDSILEIGPGPGVTTECLRRRARTVECLEIDPALADALRQRFSAANVTVRCGDATAMPYEDCGFDSVVSFTMLHHIPTPDLQDRLIREAWRVLRPAGIFAGVDSLPSPLMSAFHIGDTLTLISPETLLARLTAAGFKDAQMDIRSGRFRFSATRD